MIHGCFYRDGKTKQSLSLKEETVGDCSYLLHTIACWEGGVDVNTMEQPS